MENTFAFSDENLKKLLESYSNGVKKTKMRENIQKKIFKNVNIKLTERIING